MTKRAGILVLCAIIIVSFVGCTSKPKASENHQKIGKEVIDVVDDCLDLKITTDDAKQRIDGLYSEIDKLPKSEDTSASVSETLITGHVLQIEINLSNISFEYTEDELNNLIDNRNELAKELGLKNRVFS